MRAVAAIAFVIASVYTARAVLPNATKNSRKNVRESRHDKPPSPNASAKKRMCLRVSSSQRKSARRSRVGRMADHENTSPMLTRMPSLAEWQMRAAGDVAAVLAVAREKTEKVAGDLTAAADAPFAGGAENEETSRRAPSPRHLRSWRRYHACRRSAPGRCRTTWPRRNARRKRSRPLLEKGRGTQKTGRRASGKSRRRASGRPRKQRLTRSLSHQSCLVKTRCGTASPRVMRRPRRPTTRQGRNANPQKRKRRASSRRRRRRNAPRKSPPPRRRRRRRAGRHARGVNHLVKHDTRRGHAHRRQHISISSMHHVNSYA